MGRLLSSADQTHHDLIVIITLKDKQSFSLSLQISRETNINYIHATSVNVTFNLLDHIEP